MSKIAEKLLRNLMLIGVAAVSATVCAVAAAQDVSGERYTVTTEINGDSLSQVYGVLGVNQAAGDGNAQSNSRAIALSQDGGVAIAYTFDRQNVDLNQAVMPDVAVSRISDHAFNGTNGLISINQASGAQNMQLNAFAMAMSITGELSDATLADTRSDAGVAFPVGAISADTVREAHIDSAAFVGTSGIVQLNQSSGFGNVISNRFEMSMGQLN